MGWTKGKSMFLMFSSIWCVEIGTQRSFAITLWDLNTQDAYFYMVGLAEFRWAGKCIAVC